MPTLIAVTALVLGVTGEIKYPAICNLMYASDENIQNTKKANEALYRKPGCMKIGDETITEGDRVGETFPIYTCCTSV